MRALEVAVLQKQQAEFDSVESEATARLLAALDGTPSALIQVGSILLKRNGVPTVRNLTLREQQFLENVSWRKTPDDKQCNTLRDRITILANDGRARSALVTDT